MNNPVNRDLDEAMLYCFVVLVQNPAKWPRQRDVQQSRKRDTIVGPGAACSRGTQTTSIENGVTLETNNQIGESVNKTLLYPHEATTNSISNR